MTKEQYTPEKLFELGKNNYEKLVSYCEILEVNGFWDQARQVMKKIKKKHYRELKAFLISFWRLHLK